MHRGAASTLVLFGLSLAACTRPEAREPTSPDTTAFVGVTVVPMDAERLLPGQTVLVQGSVITAMGPAESVPVPAGARRIDGRGRFLMPGLTDMHVHLDSTATLSLFVTYGVTTVRNMFGFPVHLVWRDRIARGEILGPTVFSAGPIIDGPKPVWNGSDVAETPEEGARFVEEQRLSGYDFIKVYRRLQPGPYDAIVLAARAAGLPVAGHVPSDVGLAHVLESKQDSIEHLTGYIAAIQADDSPTSGIKDDKQLLKVRVDHVDPAKITVIARQTREAGTWNCPTLVVNQRLVPLAEAKAWLSAPEMRFVPPLMRASWDPTKDLRLKGADPSYFTALRKLDQINLTLTRALRDAGAPLLLGSDMNNLFVGPGSSLHAELKNLVAAGLSPYEALRAGTHDAAAYLHAEDTFGTVAVGRRADLLLVADNPLADVANASHIEGVMLRGRWLPKEELSAIREDLVKSYVPLADRFAGRPALVPEGTPELSGHYVIDYNSLDFAEERLSVGRMPDGARVLVAQVATDRPDPVFCAERLEVADPALGLRAAHVTCDRADGRTDLSIARVGGQARVQGTIPLRGAIAEEVPLPEDRPLLLSTTSFIGWIDSPPAAAQWLLGAQLATIAVGEERKVTALGLDLDPALALRETEVTITRKPDTAAGERSYALELRGKNFTEKRALFTDAAGALLRISTDVQTGMLGVRRAALP
jgi:imidazolonepropionase-like amidohydrolase